MNLTLLWTKWCLFALLRQCLTDKYFHNLALSDEFPELFMYHWIIMEKNAEAFKKSFGGNLKKKKKMKGMWQNVQAFMTQKIFLIAKRKGKILSDYRERKMSCDIFFLFPFAFCYILLEKMYECIVLLVYDMHIYLQHLQDICVCCRSIAWAVAQYFWIMLLVLQEQMRDFTSVTKWHWKYGLFLLHLFSGTWKGMNMCSDCDWTSQMHIIP